jgi:hypothetical protein
LHSWIEHWVNTVAESHTNPPHGSPKRGLRITLAEVSIISLQIAVLGFLLLPVMGPQRYWLPSASRFDHFLETIPKWVGFVAIVAGTIVFLVTGIVAMSRRFGRPSTRANRENR